jgi:ribosome modulation factor
MEEQDMYSIDGSDPVVNYMDLEEISDSTVTNKSKNKKKRKKDKSTNEQPDLQRAWKVGYSAAQANLPETRNPFISDSSQYQSWLDGWWSGFYDEPLHQVIAVGGQ